MMKALARINFWLPITWGAFVIALLGMTVALILTDISLTITLGIAMLGLVGAYGMLRDRGQRYFQEAVDLLQNEYVKQLESNTEANDHREIRETMRRFSRRTRPVQSVVTNIALGCATTLLLYHWLAQTPETNSVTSITIKDPMLEKFVRDELKFLDLVPTTDTEMEPLARFTHLQKLTLAFEESVSVERITGLDKLTSLEELEIHRDVNVIGANKLASLPPNLVRLKLTGSGWAQLPTFPASLKHLELTGINVEHLPDKLVSLKLEGMESLPPLPGTLRLLSIRYGELNRLPSLPTGLEELMLAHCRLGNGSSSQPNGLSELYLPDSLVKLTMADCGLKSLPKLPQSLSQLDLSGNQLSYLEDLPESLRFLDLSNNQIKILDNLPPVLEYLNVSGNELTRLPELPVSLAVVRGT